MIELKKQIRRLAGWGIASALIASSAFASQSSVTFNGQSADQLTLTSTRFRTVMQDRPVVRTCYRREFRGYRRQCTPPPRPGMPARCMQIPVYANVPYACTVVERVPVQVFDANVVARVDLRYGALPAGVTANEVFTASLEGDRLELTVRSSGKLIVAENSVVRVDQMGSRVDVTASADIAFAEAAPVVGGFRGKIRDLSVVKGKVAFKMDASLASLGYPVRVLVKRGGSVLVDQSLPLSAFTVTTSADGSIRAEAPYSVIGLGTLSRGKYSFSVASGFEIPGMKIMNESQLAGAISASRNVTLTVK